MFALCFRRYPPNFYSIRSTMLHHQIMSAKFFTFALEVIVLAKPASAPGREGIYSNQGTPDIAQTNHR